MKIFFLLVFSIISLTTLAQPKADTITCSNRLLREAARVNERYLVLRQLDSINLATIKTMWLVVSNRDSVIREYMTLDSNNKKVIGIKDAQIAGVTMQRDLSVADKERYRKKYNAQVTKTWVIGGVATTAAVYFLFKFLSAK